LSRRTSAKPSASNSNSDAPPERPTLFIDRSAWSRVLGQALTSAGIPFVAHDERFAQGAPDETWLAGVADRGWLIVTRDRRIRYKVNEQAAMVGARLHVFVFTQGGLSALETGAILVDAYPAMTAMARQHAAPTFYSIQRAGTVTRLKLRGA
jgi:hypothetical protein